MMPAVEVEIRREICARCDEKCSAFLTGALSHADPRESCPRVWSGRWGCYGPCSGAQRGLGDLVASVAQPVASLIDAVAGTNIKNCGGCAQRRAVLNRIVPSI